MKIALCQMDSQNNTERNLNKVAKMIQEAAYKQADLIVFPEVVDYCGQDMQAYAQPIPGKISQFFSDCAKKYHTYIYAGSINEKTNEKPKNTSLLLDDGGKIIAKYSKLHMFDVNLENFSYKESDAVQPGSHISICATPYGNIGMSICYDVRFGQMYRLMAKAGAQILVVVANFTKPTGMAHWETLLKARAIENTCFVAACGQTGKKTELGMEAYGHSMVIDPWGRIIACADSEETIVYADIDLTEIERVRKQIPSLQNDREDIYTLSSTSIQWYNTSRQKGG